MADASTPPPSRTFVAAAAGGFGGAVLGVVAATALMGDGDNGDGQASRQSTAEQPVAVAVLEQQERAQK